MNHKNSILKNLENDELRTESLHDFYMISRKFIKHAFMFIRESKHKIIGLGNKDVETEWKITRDCIKHSVSESIGCLEKRKDKKWSDEDCTNAAKQRKQEKLI